VTRNPDQQTALILAGGVARGAFEAGALQVLAGHGVRIAHVVGTSSGALNALMWAAAIRADRERDAADRLIDLWRNEADWMRAFHFTPVDALHGTGLSDSSRAFALMRREIPSILSASVRAVRLNLIVTAIGGVLDTLQDAPATTFEGVLSFDGSDFDDPTRRERIYQAAAASAAFPLIFHPVEVEGVGTCYDGSIVNDAPVKLATAGAVNRVIVIAPYPQVFRCEQSSNALGFITHLVDMLTHERLFRDLRDAERTNDTIARLESLVQRKQLSEAQFSIVLRELDIKPLEIVSIRPAAELPGNPFAGFVDRDLRESYIQAGRDAAGAVLSSLST
jgi:NTE family protein